jgi:galactokinase
VKTFQEIFANEPLGSGSAPGRVNLMGDHTDYNDGLVLPTAIPQRTIVEVGRGEERSRAFSHTLGRQVSFGMDRELEDFGRYIGGCLRALEDSGFDIPTVNITVASDVPVGKGLSSSAALEVATLRAINAAFTLRLTDIAIANLAWTAETKYAGVNCGIMDQMACAIATHESMLFIDTRTRVYRAVALPKDCEILVIDSGVERSLAASGYNARRAECEAAAAALGVASLRDIVDPAAAESLKAPLDKRVKHVVTENARVLAALEANAETFGALMNESHASLRDDYEVSHPAVDALVADLQDRGSVFGARMTGAGFGGACVALSQPGEADAIWSGLAAAHPRARLISVIRPQPLWR